MPLPVSLVGGLSPMGQHMSLPLHPDVRWFWMWLRLTLSVAHLNRNRALVAKKTTFAFTQRVAGFLGEHAMARIRVR